ncbi:glycosyltransferase family 4 protein [Leptolyngbya cf. ectocarpi LEGE 11479]|uniref:Glycosyltransferase family 4 protein n=1 Tax=Leptolyngbya cf. ectocarpi LEGE 11479 TaxID=1828722 RepID=A0A929F806_LEPEC|nr:glycosyltransferase family 4 protein [Leptolyngbya ectocarpi]MBE9069020.1 glycosyltransferase family 4 protein [Leptolyngbya cf. ectocarpi LEGE 11479]
MQLTQLRSTHHITGPLLMYVGNLERYQGIDLLLDSFKLALTETREARLVIIGGASEHITQYQHHSQRLGIDAYVHFIGKRPVEELAHYLAQADILVSPRVQGNNTPMKLYSYLDSGKALLATDLPTHTQVLNRQVAWLAMPTPQEFSQGMLALIQDPDLRERLGAEAQALVAKQHTYEAFSAKLIGLYDWLQGQLVGDIQPSNLSFE